MGIESESYWEESVPNYSNCDYCPPLLLSLLLFPLEGNDLADRKKEGSATRSDDDKCRFRLTSQTICRCACARLYCVSALSREVALRLAVSGLKRCLCEVWMEGGSHCQTGVDVIKISHCSTLRDGLFVVTWCSITNLRLTHHYMARQNVVQ